MSLLRRCKPLAPSRHLPFILMSRSRIWSASLLWLFGIDAQMTPHIFARIIRTYLNKTLVWSSISYVGRRGRATSFHKRLPALPNHSYSCLFPMTNSNRRLSIVNTIFCQFRDRQDPRRHKLLLKSYIIDVIVYHRHFVAYAKTFVNVMDYVFEIICQSDKLLCTISMSICLIWYHFFYDFPLVSISNKIGHKCELCNEPYIV